MALTFRGRLVLLVGAAAVALVSVLAGHAIIGAQRERELADVERRLVPRLRVESEIGAEFDRLSKGMQDAVAAQDSASLDGTAASRDRLLALIATPEMMAPADAAGLRDAVQRYDTVARSISRRLIDGETGEGIVDDIPKMQAHQAAVARLLDDNATKNRAELGRGFALIRASTQRSDRIALAFGLGGLFVVLVLSGRMSRSMLDAVQRLSKGFARFAKGELDHRIAPPPVTELAAVANEANEMAATLQELAVERDRTDWLKAGQVSLAEEIRGELDAEVVAERALGFLARRVEASAGAVYLVEERGVLRIAARYALPKRAEPIEEFGDGEGLVGQALRDGDVVEITDVPTSYFAIRSGLGEAQAAALLLVPLIHGAQKVGVIELAFLKECSGSATALLEAVRPLVASALVVSRSRERLSALLEQSREQAQRLVAQEEELRLSNQELHGQQEELRRANEELEVQRQDLSRQNAELEATRVHLQQKAQELAKISNYKSQFLANMSHELRTPLNSMLLLSHLLSENDEGNLNDKQVAHCKTIHGAGQDLLTLINQILDLARIEAGRQEVAAAEVDIQRLADHARAVFEPLAAEKQLALVVDVHPEAPRTLVSDEARIERIVTNLLGNAIKFTEQGEVRLEIGRPAADTRFERSDLTAGAVVAFVVSDTGIGIPKSSQERIFQPFEQLEAKTNRKYAGSGLGLAIARESATLLGGELSVVSTPGRGSTFTLYVPDRTPGAVQTSVAPVRVTFDDSAAVQPGEPLVLVIEDDVRLAELLVDLIHARGFKAIVAQDGEAGLRRARALSPQGIVLDVKLPDISGWTVMERLRADPATRPIPVHFISGLDERERGLSLGAIGYLTKPATRAELVAMIRALTPIAGQPALPVLVVEDDPREGRSIAELLARETIESRHVTSAAEAIDALEHARFGCMVLDLGLPDMDGVVLLETLRARNDAPLPPVVVYTGRALTRDETRQLEAYAEAVVLKDGRSTERLIDEVRLFIRHVEERLPAAQRANSAPPANDQSLRGTTILLAEDDMRTAYALSALLQGKGAEVLVAENGREALSLLETHAAVRVILMDIMMPEMDGYEALRRLRADARFANLPAIALTARAMKGERERCIAAGATDYLTKPVDGEMLLAALRSCLRPKERDAAPA
jgi:CheY-like chemotaxis protein